MTTDPHNTLRQAALKAGLDAGTAHAELMFARVRGLDADQVAALQANFDAASKIEKDTLTRLQAAIIAA